MRVDINGIQMNDGTPDENGVKWWVQEMEGWHELPVEQDIATPTGRHGGVLGASQWTARPLAFSGIAQCPNESAFWAAQDYLLAQVAHIYVPFEVQVHEGALVKRLEVLQATAPKTRMFAKVTFEWELGFVALYPFKEGTAPVSTPISSSFVVTNAGNADAWPTITFVTGGSDITMKNDTLNMRVRLDGAVPAGTVVDFKRRTVTTGATDNYSLVSPAVSNWWPVQPGANTIEVSGGTGTLEIRHTWL